MTGFIEPYNPDWPARFEEIRCEIQSALNGLDMAIQHVGSTSVPGVFAKPILDIDVIIADKSLLQEIARRLEKIGYVSKGEQGIAGRFAFRQASDTTPWTLPERKWQSHHLYVCYADSLALKNHLVFRDALRSDSGLAEAYSRLKKTSGENPQLSRQEYTKKKSEFILSVLAMQGLDRTALKEIRDANT